MQYTTTITITTTEGRMTKTKWERKEIFPANSGVLLYVDLKSNPNALETEFVEASVFRVGRGVPWLAPGRRVIVRQAAMTMFGHPSQPVRDLLPESQWEEGDFLNVYVAQQTDIVAVVEY